MSEASRTGSNSSSCPMSCSISRSDFMGASNACFGLDAVVQINDVRVVAMTVVNFCCEIATAGRAAGQRQQLREWRQQNTTIMNHGYVDLHNSNRVKTEPS